MRKTFFSILLAAILISACSTSVAPTSVPDSQEDGPTTVSGSVTYTNYFFTSGVAEPEVILEDQGGFVTRDRKLVIPVESQVIGDITSDFYTSPFT